MAIELFRRSVLLASVVVAGSLACPQSACGLVQASAPSTSTSSDGNVATFPAGGSIRIPAGWTSSLANGVVMLSPSAQEAAQQPGLTGIFSVEPWPADQTLTDPATVTRLREQYSATIEGFDLEGDPRVERGELSMRFVQRVGDGIGARLHVFLKTEGDRLVTLGIAGPSAIILQRTAEWDAMFASATRDATPHASQSPALPLVTNTLGRYAIAHPPSWTARTEGTTTLLLPPGSDVGNPQAELYALNSMPWTLGGSIDDPATAEAAAQSLLAEAPGLSREGEIERLRGGGVMLRCTGQGADGRTIKLRILARNDPRTVVALIAAGPSDVIADREKTARALFDELRIGDFRSSVASNLDEAIVGTWSTDEVLSSGSGFDSLGVTSMVTQRIFVFNADGTFTLGSRSAGGNAGVSFDSQYEITARGTWSVERNERGSFVIFSSSDGSNDRARYVMHEGQLVFGESGSRAFYSRIR